jgi:hypothetical protein
VANLPGETSMDQSLLNADRTTHHIPATIAWSATETHAYSEPPFPDDAFCIQFVVLNGERHIYRLNRETLTQLYGNISHILAKPSEAAIG